MTNLQDYRVELDAYSGPMDLLLYLVRRDEIDLYDVPIARLTEQYLRHIKLMQSIDVNMAGEFLVMAATLLEIKSQMLVPRVEKPAEGEGPDAVLPDGAQAGPGQNPLDPRYELVQALLAYKRFKDAAAELDMKRLEWDRRYPRKPPRQIKTEAGQIDTQIDEDESVLFDPDKEENAAALDFDLEDVSVVDLCDAFTRILESIGQGQAQHEVVYDDTPISLHEEDILDRLSREKTASRLTFADMFEGRGRSEAIGLLLALLELVRQRKVLVEQETASGQIWVEMLPQDDQVEPAAPAAGAQRWVDAATGQVEYEWPSEEARQRAERRNKLRALRAAKAAKGNFARQPDDEEGMIDLDNE